MSSRWLSRISRCTRTAPSWTPCRPTRPSPIRWTMCAPATRSRWTAFRSRQVSNLSTYRYDSTTILGVPTPQAYRNRDVLQGARHHALRADAGAQSAGGDPASGFELCRPAAGTADAQLHRISGAGRVRPTIRMRYGGIACCSAGRCATLPPRSSDRTRRRWPRRN